MSDPILQTLTAVGLTDKEARMYAALLAVGEGTASVLAKRAGIKRSIAYFTLTSLIERGFAQKLPSEKIKRYAAVPPSRLLQYVQANADNLRLMLPLLRGMHQNHENKPTVELYEGKEAILPVYRSMEFAKQSSYMTSWDHLQTHFPEEVRRWSANAAHPKNPNEVKNLIVDDAAGRAMARKMRGNKKQTFRLLPKGADFKMNFGISDNTVAITGFAPLFVVVIHSAAVAECARLLFDLAWKSGRPLGGTK